MERKVRNVILVSLPILWLLVTIAPLFSISTPPTPPQIYPPLTIDFDYSVNRGVYYASSEYEFMWDWYGLQNVSIIAEIVGPEGTKECAVYVEWTNGKSTCVNPE